MSNILGIYAPFLVDFKALGDLTDVVYVLMIMFGRMFGAIVSILTFTLALLVSAQGQLIV